MSSHPCALLCESSLLCAAEPVLTVVREPSVRCYGACVLFSAKAVSSAPLSLCSLLCADRQFGAMEPECSSPYESCRLCAFEPECSLLHSFSSSTSTWTSASPLTSELVIATEITRLASVMPTPSVAATLMPAATRTPHEILDIASDSLLLFWPFDISHLPSRTSLVSLSGPSDILNRIVTPYCSAAFTCFLTALNLSNNMMAYQLGFPHWRFSFPHSSPALPSPLVPSKMTALSMSTYVRNVRLTACQVLFPNRACTLSAMLLLPPVQCMASPPRTTMAKSSNASCATSHFGDGELPTKESVYSPSHESSQFCVQVIFSSIAWFIGTTSLC